MRPVGSVASFFTAMDGRQESVAASTKDEQIILLKAVVSPFACAWSV